MGEGCFAGVIRERKCIGNGKWRNMEALKVGINVYSVYLVHEVDCGSSIRGIVCKNKRKSTSSLGGPALLFEV
jgi:hypothetical protein